MSNEEDTTELRINGVTIVVTARGLTVNGIARHLTPAQQRLFVALAARRGKRTLKSDLLKAAGILSGSGTFNTYLCHIRKTLRTEVSTEGLIESSHNSSRIRGEYFVKPEADVGIARSFEFTSTRVVIHEDGRVLVGNNELDLTESERDVFHILAEHAGHVCSKDFMLTALYGSTKEKWREYKIIDVYVCKLRKKLAAATNGEHRIETVWGRGYVFCSRPAASITAIKDLPAPGVRWTIARKATVIARFKAGLVTMEELLSSYSDLSESEIRDWDRRIDLGGGAFLRVATHRLPV